MRYFLLPVIVASGLHAGYNDSLNSIYHIAASRVLKTGNHRSAHSTLLESAGQMGGWITNATQEEISLRLPCDSVSRFLLMVDSMGLITDRTYERSDRTNEYLKLIASLQAKEDLLTQYLAVLDSAGVKCIYPVSRSVAGLQGSIETVKGQLRGMLERMEYAEVKIYFEFFDRRAPLTTGHSDFGWLNSVNLPSLIGDFE